MLLPSRSSFASRQVAIDQAPVGVLNVVIAESLPVPAAARRALSGRTGNDRANVQALLPSSSLIASRNVAGGASACHSSFRTGLSLGRSIQLSNGSRWSAVWLDNTAQVEVDVPISIAWDLWSDREGVSRWMPWIHTVKVLEDQPDLSRWTLKYDYFGQNWEFSWLSRNLKPTFQQKIHWRSVDGLPNRGTVRFYPRRPTSCGVQLTISYEVPEVLGGLGMALAPVVENILQQDLDRFAKFAKTHQLESQRK
ncbi:unnamed protein product [Calypogeia fissa]